MAKNPSRVVNAIIPDRPTVAGIVFHPLTLGKVLVLEKLKHKLFEAGDKKNIQLSSEDMAQLAFVLAEDSKRTAVLLGSGRNVFDAAMYEFLERIPVTEVDAVRRAVFSLMGAGFATAPLADDASSLPPPPPAEKKMGNQPGQPAPGMTTPT